MAEILSLSKARKAKARAEKTAQAVENRIKFGRTKAEKDLAKAQQTLRDKQTDAHRRDDEW